MRRADAPRVRRRASLLIDRGRDALRDRRIRKRREHRVRIFGRARLDAASRSASASAIRSRVLGHPDARGVDAGAAAVVGDGLDHHVEVLLPVVGDVGTDHDLAVAGPVHLDARVGFPAFASTRRRRTPCRGRTSAGSRCRRHDRSGSSRRRSAGTPALIQEWMMRSGVHGSALPGLRTSGIFSTVAGAQSECTPGELLGSTMPERVGAREEAHHVAVALAEALRPAPRGRVRASGR